jgi:hypothetical protein
VEAAREKETGDEEEGAAAATTRRTEGSMAKKRGRLEAGKGGAVRLSDGRRVKGPSTRTASRGGFGVGTP